MDTTTSGEVLEQRVAILRITLLASESGGKANGRDGPRLRGVGAQLEAIPAAGSAAASGAGLQSALAELDTPEARRLAYASAVGVCAADGLREDETRFLARLGTALGLSQPETAPAATARDRRSEAGRYAFAATFALGGVARRHYAHGGNTAAQALATAYAGFVADARTLFAEGSDRVAAQARALDERGLVPLARSR